MTDQLHAEILAFRPLYEEASQILSGLNGYYKVRAPAGAIDFAGLTYPGRGISQHDRNRLREIDCVWSCIRSRNPELCREIRVGNEYPFTYNNEV